MGREPANPNGVESFSPGLARSAGLPWVWLQNSLQPQRGCVNRWYAGGFNPFRVVYFLAPFPRVVPASRDNPGLDAITPLG